MNYSPEFKEAMLRRMLPPNNESITKIAKKKKVSLNRPFATGAIKRGRKDTPLLERMHLRMTGAHRINF